jgi:hypothetical protein
MHFRRGDRKGGHDSLAGSDLLQHVLILRLSLVCLLLLLLLLPGCCCCCPPGVWQAHQVCGCW